MSNKSNFNNELSIKKIFIFVFVSVLFLSAGLTAYFVFFNKPAKAPAFKNDDSKSNNNNKIKFIATGDMIPHDAINQEAKQEDSSYDYTPMFGEMKQLFDKSDLRFCNQAVLGGGSKFGISGYPKFNSPTEFARDMAKLGCNLINTGSNHTNDFDQSVIDASLEAWQGLPGIYAIAGANSSDTQKQKINYFEIKGVKFAFVSYTTYTNEPPLNSFSVTMYSDELAQKQITEAKSKADIVIASVRWGTEYSSEANESQKNLAKKLSNFGADVILGHGTHYLQPVEQLKLDDGRSSLVWYGLGNFLNAQLEPASLFNGIAVLEIDTKTKQVSIAGFLPTYMHYEWTKEEKQNVDLLARHNFRMYTFDDGQSALLKSQNNTTFEEQTNRIKHTLNEYIPINILTKENYFQL